MSDEKDMANPDSSSGFEILQSKLPIADFGYYTYTWPAWFVMPERKKFVPVVRFAMGDIDGNVLIKREVLITGLIELIEDLSSTVLKDMRFISSFEGYSVDAPLSKDDIVRTIESANNLLNQVKTLVVSCNWIDTIIDD